MRLLFCFCLLSFGSLLFAQVPLYTYHFDGNLNEAGGGPTLTEVGAGASSFGSASICGGAPDATYVWPSGRGLRMDVAAPVSVYTVELWMSLTTTLGYRRVTDVTGLTSDCGIYELSGGFTFYCVGGSGGSMSAGTLSHVVITRDAANVVTVYLNGCTAMTTTDAGGQGIITAANDLILFKDNGGEESGGTCAQFCFYDVALTGPQVNARYNAVCPSGGGTPSPAVMTYDFSTSTLLEQSMGGPALTELANATPADGYFTTGTPCGVSEVVYEFPTNAGLEWSNTAAGNFMGQNHSVELFMEFDNLTSWKRILDYSNRTSDLGVYAFNGAIQFYSYGTSGSVPFAPNVWSHVLLVRRKGITPCMDSTYYDMYVDGLLRLTLTNTGTASMPSAANLVHFFQDDLAIPNEASSGSVFYLRIYNYALNATQAFTAYTERCDVIVLNGQKLRLGITPRQERMELRWEHALGDVNSFTLLRSSDGLSFMPVGQLNGQTLHQVDDQLPSSGQLFYRVRAQLPDGSTVESNTVVANLDLTRPLMAFPNPTAGTFTVLGAGEESHLQLFDAQGREVKVPFTQLGDGWQCTLPPDAGAGMYLLRVSEGGFVRSLRMVVVR